MYDPLRAKLKVAIYSSVAFLFGLGIASGMGWTGNSYAMPVLDHSPRVEASAVQPALDLSDAFVNISRTVTPGVVRIQVRRPVTAAQIPQHQGIPFLDFFGPDTPNPEEDPEAEEIPRQDRVGGGSGFLVSEDGYILTNNHVVEGASEIQVFLSDRRSFEAELVGRDPFTDVAVIKIEGEGFLPMSLGDSDDVDVGEWVVAIGNPGFGAGTTLDYSVTTGIVSAIGRPLSLLSNELFRDQATRETSGFAIENFIQTDAVINPGNSGGPMVNLQGQVVGINSAIATQTGFYQGYGFAIPIDLAERVMEDLIEYGRVKRPYLGVRLGGIDDVNAEYYGLPAVSGVEIEGVTAGDPADRAGLQLGDVIWEVEGTPVATQGQLQANIARRHPGDEVTLTIYRDGRPMDLELTLGEILLQDAPDTNPRLASRIGAFPTLGLQLEDFDRRSAEAAGLDDGGVVVTGVEPNSPAARRAMARGLRIIAVNEQPVESAGQATALLSRAEPGSIVSILTVVPATPPGTRSYHVRVPG